MGSFAVQQDLFDHSADVDGAVLTGTAAIDLLEGALDLDRPTDLAMFNAPFQPVRYHHPVAEPPGRPARWHIEPAIAGSPAHRAGWT
jgi:hypothetical protein